jgi:hypothetical protein
VRHAVLVAIVVPLLATVACDSERIDPLDEFASASCAAIQSWVDAVEDHATQLSDAVTRTDRASARAPYYRVFARALNERADDTVRQLRHLAPAAGDGKVAADTFIAALLESKRVTAELVTLADSFPDSDDDPEPVVSRISSMLVRLEKAFSYPSRARDALAARYPVFDRVPSCVDYEDPVT